MDLETHIDFIGDIHGHAFELVTLLNELGYAYKDGSYSHPSRKALFVGDYIDRGPNIKETLRIVRAMVESGNAVALMGNHEYNALCFHAQEKEGGHLRKHDIKNVIQHFETLKQFQNDQKDYEETLEWFKTLPLYYETETFRAVHACWDTKSIAYLKNVLVNARLTDELLQQSVQKGSELYNAIDKTLKGAEINLPKGKSFMDKDGNERYKIRTKWWSDPAALDFNTISVVPIDDIDTTEADLKIIKNLDFYNDDKPVFFGHYWLSSKLDYGKIMLRNKNACCLDYSVAKKGELVAYRFDGERELDEGKFVWV